MRKWVFISVIALGISACTPSTPTGEILSVPECAGGTHTQADILVMQAKSYEGLDNKVINQIALDLRTCVGHADPSIRDGLVFESLSGFLRNEQLTDDTKLQLFDHMLALMDGPYIEPGYTRSFAALDMSELARADRISPYLSQEQREMLVQTTSSYMIGITDYRGYVDNEGWRHNIAHTADIILQLSLNPNVTTPQLQSLKAATGTQISPPNGHTYIHGETERLARAILYLARRGEISPEEWDAWFSKLAEPNPFSTWGEVYKSEVGLARLHNTKAFLSEIYINANETQNANIKALLNPARDALIKLP